jgi:hypothetical protein
MIDLVRPDLRILLYQEVHRVLKPYCSFGFLAAKLANGYGIWPSKEFCVITACGFHKTEKNLFLKCGENNCWHIEPEFQRRYGPDSDYQKFYRKKYKIEINASK